MPLCYNCYTIVRVITFFKNKLLLNITGKKKGTSHNGIINEFSQRKYSPVTTTELKEDPLIFLPIITFFQIALTLTPITVM